MRWSQRNIESRVFFCLIVFISCASARRIAQFCYSFFLVYKLITESSSQIQTMISTTRRLFLFLEFFGVMIMMQVIALPTVTGTDKVADMQLNFWREKLHSVQVPQAVSTSLSPLTEEEVNAFAKIIKDGNLKSYSTQFCKSANLLCYQPVDVVLVPITVFAKFRNNDPSDIFFSPKKLREGGQITLPQIYNPGKAFLPRNLSDLIPFSTAALLDVLSSFGLPERSNMAMNMNMSLFACQAKPQPGEIRRCTTSIEGMIDFVLSNMGSSESVELVFHPAPTEDSGKKVRVRKIVEKLYAPSSPAPLACHRLMYPYGVLYCHSINGTVTFDLELEVLEKNGNIYNATALCHPNEQNKESVYCHLILGDSLLWLAKEKR